MKVEGAPTELKELKIKGDEVMECGVPARLVGKVLEELLYDCALNARLNDEKTLLARVEKGVQEGKFI